MNDEEKDLFIKGKLKNGKIPEKIDNLFNNSLKFIENKGVNKMENNFGMGQNQNMNPNNQNNQYQNMNFNNQNNNRKKKMSVGAKRVLATAACLTLLLGGGNIYASTQGYDNIFFLISDKLGFTKDAYGKDEILSDRDITISYRAIEISPGTSIQINSLVIKDNEARLKMQVDETPATVGITPLMYKVKDENGNQLCNTFSNYSKSEGTESQFKEELLLKGLKNDTKKLTLEIYDYNIKKLVDIEINLENKKIDIIGNQEEVKKISEEELKQYLGAFAALNYNEVMNIDYQDPVTVNFAENTTKINNTKKLMVAEQIAKIKGINIYYEVSNEGKKLETARIIPEKIHEVIKSFTTLELNEENILDRNEDVYMYSKSGSQGTAAAGKPLYYRYPSTSNRSYLAPTCLEVTDISYIGGIYNVAFKYCYSTTLDKGFEQSANIEDLPVYEMSMGLILDENNQYSKYRISSMSEAVLSKEDEDSSVDLNNKEAEKIIQGYLNISSAGEASSIKLLQIEEINLIKDYNEWSQINNQNERDDEGFVKTHIKYSVLKNKMLEYMTEDLFQTYSDAYKNVDDVLWVREIGASGYSSKVESLKVLSSSENAIIYEVTIKTEDFNENEHVNVEKIELQKNNNGKFVVSARGWQIEEEENNNLKKYIGAWYESEQEYLINSNADCLTIKNIEDNKITFDIYLTRLAEFHDVTVSINNNNGTFEAIESPHYGMIEGQELEKMVGNLQFFDNKIKLVVTQANNIPYLNPGFEVEFNYQKNEDKINYKYIGTWNTESVYSLNGEEVSLVAVLGTGYLNYGSKLYLTGDGTFGNYIQPIQSGELSNTGTWEYYDEDLEVDGVGHVFGKIVLKYDDGRKEELKMSTGRDSQAVLIYSFGNDYRLHLYK